MFLWHMDKTDKADDDGSGLSVSRTGRYVGQWLIETQMNADFRRGEQIDDKELERWWEGGAAEIITYILLDFATNIW